MSRPAPPVSAPATHGVVTLLVLTALVVLTQLYAAIPLLNPVGRAREGDATFALATSFSLAYATGFLVWGPVSDRFGRKRVLVVAVGALALVTLLCSFATSMPMLALLRAGQGLAAAGFALVALAYVTECVAPSRRAGAVGAMSTAFLVAGILGQVIAIHLGWTWFFVIFAVVLVTFAGLLLVMLAEPTNRCDVPSMISLYAETSAPNRGSGMAINGFMLFTGASLGPLLANGIESFPALMLVLAGLLIPAQGCFVTLARASSTAGV